MEQKTITVRETFTRDQFLGKTNPEGNDVLASRVIFSRLRQRGVPLIGVLGVIAVEWGVLTIAHDDGLDGDEWTFTWIGKEVPAKWRDFMCKPGRALSIDKPLAPQIAAAAAAQAVDDDEL